MDDRMQRRGPWIPWALTSVMLVLVALAAYSFGAHREVGAAMTDPAARAWPYHPFFGIWTVLILFWIFGGFRRMWWGGYYYRPWGYRRYPPPWHHAEPDDWEEWHRREHERMSAPRSSAGSSRSETSQGPI